MKKKSFAVFGGLSLLPLMLSISGGLMIGTGTHTLYYGEGASYLSDSPETCVNCHIMREHYSSWQGSSHHTVAVCNDCHSLPDPAGKYCTKIENGFFHSVAFTLGTSRDPLVIRERNSQVLQQACLHCHGEFTEYTHSVRHAAETQEFRCVHCHASVGHGP